MAKPDNLQWDPRDLYGRREVTPAGCPLTPVTGHDTHYLTPKHTQIKLQFNFFKEWAFFVQISPIVESEQVWVECQSRCGHFYLLLFFHPQECLVHELPSYSLHHGESLHPQTLGHLP